MRERATSISLPVTRRQLFGFTYRTHLPFLMKLSLLLTLFALPLYAVEIVTQVFQSGVLSDFSATGDISYYRLYLSRNLFFALLRVPAGMILSVGLTGAFALMKAYTFADGYTFWGSFRQGIREDARRSLPVSLFFAVVSYLAEFSRCFLSMRDISWYVPAAVVATVLQLLMLGAYLFCMCQIPIYRASCPRLIKNGFLFTGKCLFGIVGIALVSLAPVPAAGLFGSLTVIFVTAGLFAFLLFGNGILLITLYCQHCFDELINRDHYPEIYRKGLFDGEHE